MKTKNQANQASKLNELNINALQEYYALKFYRVYGVFPKGKNLETNKPELIKKINLLDWLTQGV